MACLGSGESAETYRERQNNEIELLEAVYMEDVKDLRKKDSWKVRRPPEIIITLRPQESVHSKEFHVQVDLHVKCHHKYPDLVPELKLEGAKCLSNQLKCELQKEIDNLAGSLVGEVMLLQLCQHIQTFLHLHNNPPGRSFYEEMITNQQKKDEKQRAEEMRQNEIVRKRSEKQAQDIDAIILKRQEAVKEDARKRRELAKQVMTESERLSTSSERLSTSSDPSTPQGEDVPRMTPILKDTGQRLRSRNSASPDTLLRVKIEVDGKAERRRRTSTPMSGSGGGDTGPMLDIGACQHHIGTSSLTFSTPKEKIVYRGKCLGHSLRGSTVYAGMDATSGDLVAISEWVLKWRHCNRKLKLKEDSEKERTEYLNQVCALEQEMSNLLQLNHSNLLKYQGFKYTEETGKITVYVLMDYVGGGCLEQYVKQGQPMAMELIKLYAEQLLDVLQYLHENTVVHGDLRVSSLLLDQKRNLRLADCWLVKRLTDLMIKADSKNQRVKFDLSAAPNSCQSSKKDVYRLGIVLLMLATGESLVDENPEVPSSLEDGLKDFLSKCLVQDTDVRWSVEELCEHGFMKAHLVMPPASKLTSENPRKDRSPEEENVAGDQDVSELDIPFLPTVGSSGSRLTNEFRIMTWLGKGAFGDVIKVHNKLDGRFYAIKRIPLNPNRKQFTRKITREVKLLSRLNHENVVRYYNSWIETSDEPAGNDSSTASSEWTPNSPSKSSYPKKSLPQTNAEKSAFQNSLGLQDDIEKFAPSVMEGSVNWSVSLEITGSRLTPESDSSEEDDVGDVFGKSFLLAVDSEDEDDDDDDDDDEIAFEKGSQWQVQEVSSHHPAAVPTGEEAGNTSEIPCLQFLYIQMEFCEKSTLRNCIDAGLHEDVNRVWRLFREIIEGLLHIHDQGMIHRDLKPVNIFLDSNDHVKIGDFGLATTEIIAKQSTIVDQTPGKHDSGKSMKSLSKSDSFSDLTGKVGTALYVSPEMSDSTSVRVNYNQKVDIYSLGVIFFEMCYRSLATGMERVKVLTNVRQQSITLPMDFDEVEMPNQAAVIRWLLNHNPAKRPNCKELLQSSLLPPPHMEEAEFNEVLRSAISNPDSKAYHHMLNALFQQPILPANDFAYDNDFYKHGGLGWSERQAVAQQHIINILEQLFSRHGAVRVTTPLLMPRNPIYENNESYVNLMDHSGGLVALSHDLRAPFARYVARNSINSLKRFCIEKVFRENRLYGVHPRELMAASFDIVTPTPANLIPDAEVLHVVYEIIQEFPELSCRNFHLRINHASLLKAILVHCGIPDELHNDVYNILGDTKTEKLRKLQLQTHLCSLSLSEDQVESLYSYVMVEKPFGQVASMLRKITHTKGLAASLAKKGLHEMEAVISHAQTMGCKFEPVLALGLVYSINHFSGSIFQVVMDVRRKKKSVVEVLAAGGRYDDLISHFRRPGSLPLFQCAVGLSISLEKILSAVLEGGETQLPTPYDIMVCSLGHKFMVKEKLSLAHQLWAAGLRVEIHHDTSQSLEDIQDFCKNHGISCLAILKDIDKGFVKVQLVEKDREKVSEKRLAESELPDYLLRIQAAKSEAPDAASQMQRSSSTGSQLAGDGVGNISGSSGSGSGAGTSGLPQYNITFIQSDKEKLAKNIKRAYESQIFATLGKVLACLSNKLVVEVVAVSFSVHVINCIAENIRLPEEHGNLKPDIASMVDKYPRYKKYFTKIFDHILDVREQKRNMQRNVCLPATIIVYGLKDDSYKVLL